MERSYQSLGSGNKRNKAELFFFLFKDSLNWSRQRGCGCSYSCEWSLAGKKCMEEEDDVMRREVARMGRRRVAVYGSYVGENKMQQESRRGWRFIM